MQNTKRKFIDEYGRVPLGLWVHVLKTAQAKNINVQLSTEMQQYIQQFNLGYDLFKKYVDNTFRGALNEKGEKFKPYDYQIEAAHRLLNIRNVRQRFRRQPVRRSSLSFYSSTSSIRSQ
jgi:parvulin-like peptidyl-prolyl isomerase